MVWRNLEPRSRGKNLKSLYSSQGYTRNTITASLVWSMSTPMSSQGTQNSNAFPEIMATLVWWGMSTSMSSQGTQNANTGLRGAALARCAAKFSNDHSLAAGLESFTGGAVSKDNLFVNALLGSDAATLSNLITGPDRGRNLLSKGISQGAAGVIKVVGNLPNPGSSALAGTVTVGETAGGTAFVSTWTDATIATSVLGKTAGKAFVVFSIGKAIWDGSTYIFGAVQCY
jgi:hypothetical protein